MSTDPTPGLGRRGLFGLAATGAATAAALGTAVALNAGERQGSSTVPSLNPDDARGRTWDSHGAHQAGITTPVPAATTVLALDLNPGTTKDALRRLMTIWSHDAQALMSGVPVPGDPQPDLAQPNVSLSVTFGFGPGVFRIPGLADKKPAGLADVPPMQHDKLRPEYSGGDLLVLISADDPTTVAYAERILTRDARTFASLRWSQQGSWRGVGADGLPATGRNLFGQVDGTGNVTANSADVIWAGDDQPWFSGGTTLVVRRIEMNLATWDELVRDRQELAMGRNLANGAPLTGSSEFDQLDLAAKGPDGQHVIPLNAHARLAHPSENRGRTMLRRSVNYSVTEQRDGLAVATSGLVFMAFQSSVPEVFTPVQKRLDESDALNEWTTAIGSAVFAIPGGFAKDGVVASGLFG
ncbi:Dyp-type peroxidase [Propionibacteriaceae bacterium G1746]